MDAPLHNSNIILIGMPGAGKSTAGVILAKRIGFGFIDTDLLIQQREHCRLQQIIDARGLNYFRSVEEQVLLELAAHRSVIATGGSVIYCPRGLQALRALGPLIYLQTPLTALEERIADMGQRGLVMNPGQTYAELYRKRTPLYQQTADYVVACGECHAEEVAAAVESLLGNVRPEILRPRAAPPA